MRGESTAGDHLPSGTTSASVGVAAATAAAAAAAAEPARAQTRPPNRSARGRGGGGGGSRNRRRGVNNGNAQHATQSSAARGCDVAPDGPPGHVSGEAHPRGQQQQQQQQQQQHHHHHRNEASLRRRGATSRGRGKRAATRGAREVVHRGAEADEPDDDGQALCIVCAEELTYFAVGECNHPDRCSKCAMRSRILLKDQSCPECKTVLERLVVARLPASHEAPRFESFDLWGDYGGPDAKFDDQSSMIFYSCSSHYDDLVRARALICPVGGCRGAAGHGQDGRKQSGKGGSDRNEAFSSKEALLEHMKNSHQRFLCRLCLDNRPLFVSEQEVFHGAAALRKHEARVSGGHPLCRFCSRRFFDNTALYDHMTGTHINCHLCPEEHQHRYFRGEAQLRDHLRTTHFLCDRGDCRRRGVVSAFNSPQELKAHLLEEHGIADRRSADVGFSVRRAGRDGSGVHASSTYYGASGDGSPAAQGAADFFAAPDPDAELTGGVMVSVPSSREAQGQSASSLTNGAWGGGATETTSPVQEAFPSLPTAAPGPRALPGRHEFSLVGRARPGRGVGAASSAITPDNRAGPVPISQEQEKEKRVLMRNKRLAEALGIRAALGAGAAIGGAKVGTTAGGTAVAMGIGDGLEAIRDHLNRTNYSTYLVSWARENRSQLLKLERRLADLVADPRGTSTQLKPMPATHRKAVHELAVHYGLVTQSFDLEPKRYVSAIKQQGCRIPGRLLSVAARDPSYKGIDEGASDAAAAPVPGAAEPAAPHARAAALRLSAAPPSAAAPGLTRASPPPAAAVRTATVTSISSVHSTPAAAPPTDEHASGKVSANPKKTRAGGAQQQLQAASQGQEEVASNRSSQPQQQQQHGGKDAPVTSNSNTKDTQQAQPQADKLVVIHSLQAAVDGEAVLESLRMLVPPRTVVGFRPATAGEVSAAGVAGTGGPRTSGPLIVEFSNGTSASRAREKIERDAEQLIAAARVTRADYHAPFRARSYPAPAAPNGEAERGRSLPGAPPREPDFSVRDNWDSSDDDEDANAVEEADGNKTGNMSGTEADPGPSPSPETPPDDTLPAAEEVVAHQHTESTESPALEALHPAESSPGDSGADVTRGAGQETTETSHDGHVESTSASAAPPKRQSKWSNSVLKGRLSRPSDGRTPTVEVEAQERRERLQKLRRLEETRRENRQRRDQAKRAERANAGKVDAHAFVWETLAGSSSVSDEKEGEVDQNPEREKASSSTASTLVGDGEPRIDVSRSSERQIDDVTTTGWACGRCTYWNDVVTEAGDTGTSGSARTQCSMCEAEGPRNAASPWQRA